MRPTITITLLLFHNAHGRKVLAPRAACDWSPTASGPGICTANIPTFYTTVPVPISTPGSSSPTATAAAGDPAVTCVMQDQDPGEGIDEPYCECTSGASTITAPLMTVANPTIYSQSCEYSTWPGTTATPTVDLPGPSTNSRICQVCTPYAINADNCNTIPNCTPQVAVATVTVGSAPVHVGTLTGTALYTSVSNALESLCPSVTQSTSSTQCSPTGESVIQGIEYVGVDEDLETGSLVIKVPTSGYNQSSLRDAMIQSIALSMQTSATGGNCFNASYTVELRRRSSLPMRLVERWLPAPVLDWLPAAKRDHPYPYREEKVMCNAAYFHTANYYTPYWREAATPGPSDFINALVTFEASNSDVFLCEFLDMLADGLTLLAPEFAVADFELEEGINALCCLVDGGCQLDQGA